MVHASPPWLFLPTELFAGLELFWVAGLAVYVTVVAPSNLVATAISIQSVGFLRFPNLIF